jgi:hypothetical protein
VGEAMISLVAGSGETRFQLEATMSRFIHLAVLDALCSALAAEDPGRTRRGSELSAKAKQIHGV